MKKTMTMVLVMMAFLVSVGRANARSYVVSDWSNCLEVKTPTVADYCVFVAIGTYATGDDLCAAIQTAMVAQLDPNARCLFDPSFKRYGFSLILAHEPLSPGSYSFLANSGKDRRLGIWAVISFNEAADQPDQGDGLAGISNLPVIPFGSIDTPAPNSTVSGTIAVQGWALAQRPAAMTGPGITLYVDGIARGTVAYGGARPDVQAAFPDYVNSAAAAWAISFDTRALVNGVHTMSVNAYDDLGRGASFGSRSFTTTN